MSKRKLKAKLEELLGQPYKPPELFIFDGTGPNLTPSQVTSGISVESSRFHSHMYARHVTKTGTRIVAGGVFAPVSTINERSLLQLC